MQPTTLGGGVDDDLAAELYRGCSPGWTPTGRIRIALTTSGAVEFIREELEQEAEFLVYGQGKPYRCQASAFERPGPFCNPVVGTMITSGAWLMLAMMENFLTERGATFAFCDTDSMAVAR